MTTRFDQESWICDVQESIRADMGGGGGSGGSQTVTQIEKLQPFQEDFAKQNQSIAASLASRPFPTYQGQMVAGFDPLQQQGMQMAVDASTAHQPYLQQAGQQWSPQAAQQYMSPYVMQALQPQIEALNIQQGQQRNQIGANATQAGAFGDARHGVADSMNDFYGNMAMSGLVGQGMNQAYQTGQQAFQADQTRQAQLASLAQQLGLSGSEAVFGAGTQKQELSQQNLNTAYQNFMNQMNWPIEMLNLRTSVLAQSPYSTTRLTTAPPANSTAQNLGAFGALAGGMGSLMNGFKS